MAGCCNARGCDRLFNEKFARRMAKKYRKRGLDKTARKMVAFLEERGVEGATVLEVGGGVGEIQIELLERGASHATNLELSPGYDEEATRLLQEHGLVGKAIGACTTSPTSPNRRTGGRRRLASGRLLLPGLRAAARRGRGARAARGRVQLSAAEPHVAHMGHGREPRAADHAARVPHVRASAAAMVTVLEQRGLRETFARHSLVWQVAGLERA